MRPKHERAMQAEGQKGEALPDVGELGRIVEIPLIKVCMCSAVELLKSLVRVCMCSAVGLAVQCSAVRRVP
jgi:hypothetical protein